jgi:DNA ligase (NAD+)
MYSVGYDHGTRFVDHGRNMLLGGVLKFVEAQVPPQRLMALAVPLYTLGVAKLSALDRMGGKSAANLVAGLDKSRQATLPRFLYALGIRQVGETTAKDLARHFGGIDRLMTANVEELLQVKDVGPIVAQSIRTFFDQPHNVEVVEQLRAAGIHWPVQEAALGPQPLAGKTLVLTGTLPTPREVEAFLADKTADKRDRKIDELLERPG